MGRREFDDAGLAFTQIVEDCRFLRGSIGGRPNILPCALARSSPDLTRSRIIARSKAPSPP